MFKNKWVFILSICTAVIFLPDIITPFVYHRYDESFYEDVKSGILNISDGKPYCIIAPVLVPKRQGYTRDWRIIPSIQNIDLQHIVDHMVREKLVFYAKEGRGIKRRGSIGREMHFGVLVEESLFIWSFKRRQLVEIPHTPHRLANELRRDYETLASFDNLYVFPSYIDKNNYFCPHLHH